MCRSRNKRIDLFLCALFLIFCYYENSISVGVVHAQCESPSNKVISSPQLQREGKSSPQITEQIESDRKIEPADNENSKQRRLGQKPQQKRQYSSKNPSSRNTNAAHKFSQQTNDPKNRSSSNKSAPLPKKSILKTATSTATTLLTYHPTDDANVFQSNKFQHLPTSNSVSLLFSHGSDDLKNAVHSLIKFDLESLVSGTDGGSGEDEHNDLNSIVATLKLCNPAAENPEAATTSTPSSPFSSVLGEGVIITLSKNSNWREELVTWDSSPPSVVGLQAPLIGVVFEEQREERKLQQGRPQQQRGKQQTRTTNASVSSSSSPTSCLWDVFDVTPLIHEILTTSNQSKVTFRVESIYEYVGVYASKDGNDGYFAPRLEVCLGGTKECIREFMDEILGGNSIVANSSSSGGSSGDDASGSLPSSSAVDTTTAYSKAKPIPKEKKDDDRCIDPNGQTVSPWNRSTEYFAGDYVTNISTGRIYECRIFPFSGWCDDYEPGVTSSVYWMDAWTDVFSCLTLEGYHDVMQTNSSPQVNLAEEEVVEGEIESMAQMTFERDDCGVSAFSAIQSPIKAGDRVTEDRFIYSCKPDPMSKWCSLPGYEPGLGYYWTMAWDKEGPCL